MLELKIGQKVTIECVEDEENTGCAVCCFDDSSSCSEIACAGHMRKDGKSVHYIAKDESGAIIKL